MGSCGKLNHSVLLVGYGVTSKGKKFWIIKDSATGKIIRIARDVGSKGGAFGIARSACFPVKISANCDGSVQDDIALYVKMFGKFYSLIYL